ncbi:hypothetical protein BDV95DRAFT_179015 [Massariosphaeria phaeospora]|uniref:Uncharacterized protein n=1 Tax=Massariosphaeria phaeospora TaxID=100035 RepID=A0A7C8M3K6_9PLEO|nr:hypothetical protein BDV95DRAFT_179015 [Massariosphaeria phaeospora]
MDRYIYICACMHRVQVHKSTTRTTHTNTVCSTSHSHPHSREAATRPASSGSNISITTRKSPRITIHSRHANATLNKPQKPAAKSDSQKTHDPREKPVKNEGQDKKKPKYDIRKA